MIFWVHAISLKSEHGDNHPEQSNARGQDNHQAINPTHETDQSLRPTTHGPTTQQDPQHMDPQTTWKHIETHNSLRPTTHIPASHMKTHWDPQLDPQLATCWINLLLEAAYSEEGCPLLGGRPCRRKEPHMFSLKLVSSPQNCTICCVIFMG